MATATATITLSDVVAFLNNATEYDLDIIHKSSNDRRRALRNQRAAVVTVGMNATLGDLSPKYLNGLSGKVTAINGQRGTVTLDEQSTNNLRFFGSRRFPIPMDVKEYDLPGVPLSSIIPA